jgi:uncharacterized protein YcgI (DUF1989 family)
MGVSQQRIPPQRGIALTLNAGDLLRITAPEGEQVADVYASALSDHDEVLSSGRSLDYAGRLYLSTGDVLYSNRSQPLFTIVVDTVRRHDFLLAPCSPEMFRKLHGYKGVHPSCFDNLATALAEHGFASDRIGTTFNAFMNVEVDPQGALHILPPLCTPSDELVLRAEMALLVGVTACSAEQSNNGTFKPIDVRIVSAG